MGGMFKSRSTPSPPSRRKSRSRSRSRSGSRTRRGGGGGGGDRRREKRNRSRSRSVQTFGSRSKSPPHHGDNSPPRRHRSRSPRRDDARDVTYSCKRCKHSYRSVRDLAHHEVREHTMEIECNDCSKKSSSIRKLMEHAKKDHENKALACYYCRKEFSPLVSDATDLEWGRFKNHVYNEVVDKRLQKHTRKMLKHLDDAEAIRGFGKCPHGPPRKCRNFPDCPGRYCYFSHPQCRHDYNCTNQQCPYDHIQVPRTCHKCVNEGGRGKSRSSWVR